MKHWDTANAEVVLTVPRASLWLRVPVALLALGILVLAANFASIGLFQFSFLAGNIQGSSWIGFIGCLGFGLLFLATWFHEIRWIYDRDHNVIIGLSRLLWLRRTQTKSLAGVSHLSAEHGRRSFVVGGGWYQVWLVFADGRREFLMTASKSAQVSRLSQVTGLRRISAKPNV